MTPDQAEDLATRTLVALDDGYGGLHDGKVPRCLGCERVAADRERVASDLALLTFYDPAKDNACWRDYAESNLRRTARLYGVTE